MNPLVSILIPAHNAAPWIAQTLRSAIGQTWQHKEIIVIDDGSTDKTPTIANRFKSKNLKVVSQINQGAANARNHAYSLAQGDYIQWLDADDLLSPEKIERQIKILIAEFDPKTLASCEWAHFYYRPHRAKFYPSSLWCDLDPLEWLIRKMRDGQYMQTATWLTSRQLTQAAGPWNTQLLGDDDGEYFCRIKLQSDRISFVPEARVYYRQVTSNRLSYVGRSNKKLEAHWISMQLHIKYLLSLKDNELTRSVCIAYLQRYLIYYIPNRLDIADQFQNCAIELKRQLDIPQLSSKYDWIQKIFNLSAAKNTEVTYNNWKTSILSTWDYWRFQYETKISVIS